MYLLYLPRFHSGSLSLRVTVHLPASHCRNAENARNGFDKPCAVVTFFASTPGDARRINHRASLFLNPGSLLSESLFRHATPVSRNLGVRLRWTRCRIACLLQLPITACRITAACRTIVARRIVTLGILDHEKDTSIGWAKIETILLIFFSTLHSNQQGISFDHLCPLTSLTSHILLHGFSEVQLSPAKAEGN
jgi:hypothetical protein